MKSKMKRMLSLLCAVAMIVTAVPINNGVQNVEAGNTGTKQENPKYPDASFSRKTFSSFGIKDTEYTYENTLGAMQKYEGNFSLDKTVICGDILFPKTSGVQYYIGGKTNNWYGLLFQAGEDGVLYLRLIEEGISQFLVTFDTKIAKTELLGEWINLMTSTEIVDADGDGEENDVKLGIWFNGVLYNNEYITIKDFGPKLGSRASIYCPKAGSSIAFRSNKEPNKDFKVKTFASFGIEDKEYTYENTLGRIVEKEGTFSLDETVICGDILFPKTNGVQYYIGGKTNPWYGLMFQAGEDGILYLRLIEEGINQFLVTFDPKIAKAELLGEWVNLMMSTEFVDADGDGQENDVSLGIWFNGVLYNNEYITIKDIAPRLGSRSSIYCPKAGSAISFRSVSGIEQPNARFVKKSFSSFGIEDKEYTYENTSGALIKHEGNFSLDETVICGDILFPKENGAQYYIGGKTSNWHGLLFQAGEDGVLYLRLIDEEINEFLVTFDPKIAKTELLGEWVNLMMSTEFLDADGDGQEDDVKLGIWFNDVLYNNSYITVKDIAPKLGCKSSIYCPKAGSSISFRSIKEPNENFKVKTFSSFGIEDKEYTYENTSGAIVKKEGTFSLDETVICGDILFPKKNGAQYYIGGKTSNWHGLLFQAGEDGILYLQLIDEGINEFLVTFDPKIAKAELLGEWVNLMMSTEFVDADGDGEENDVELGIWFNGLLYDDNYITIKDFASKLGSKSSIYCPKAGSAISFRSIAEPEQPNARFVKKSFSSFGIEDKEYTYENTSGALIKHEGNFSLDETVICGDILFPKENGAQYYIGGKTSNWHGLLFQAGEDGILYLRVIEEGINEFLVTFDPKIAKTELLGEWVNLMMSTEFLDADGDGQEDDVKLGIWFNEVLYNNSYITVKDIAPKLGSKSSIYCPKEGSAISFRSIKQPNTDFVVKTFSSFGIKDGEYTYENTEGKMVERQGTFSLDETVICGDILFPKENGVQYYIGGKTDPWYGLMFQAGEDGILYLRLIEEGISEFLVTFDPKIAKAELLGEWVNLMMSTEFVDADGDGQEDDVSLGIWFNGLLYGDNYITIKDFASKLGSRSSIYCPKAGSAIAFRSLPDTEQPNEAFRKRTFSSFGIKDGEYTYESTQGRMVSSKGRVTLDETVICGDILLPKTGAVHFYLGGQTNPWYGLLFQAGEDGILYLRLIEEGRNEFLATFDPAIARSRLLGEWVNLMISTEYVDADGDGQEDDVKLGIWFDQVLYNNSYITISDLAPLLGNTVGIYCAKEGAAVSFKSIPELHGNDPISTQKPNPNFQKRTFASFGLEDGTYTYESTKGQLLSTKGRIHLDETVVYGDILFPKTGGVQFYLGGSSPWYGLLFHAGEDGVLYLRLVEENISQFLVTFKPELAGTELLGEWLHMAMSTEFVDADGDGQENDVKLGIWFNDILYNDSYIIVKDFAPKLGSVAGIYCKEGASFSIRSIAEYNIMDPFDYETFGLTKDWERMLLRNINKKPYTGDNLGAVGWTILASLSLAGVLLCSVMFFRRKRKGTI